MDPSAAGHTTSHSPSPIVSSTQQPTTASYAPQQNSSKTSSPTTTPSTASPEVRPKEVVNPLVDPLLADSPFNATPPTSPAPASSRQPQHPVDAMRREYPKPEGEIDVKEALAREPLRWTLGHWRKNSKEIVPRVETEEIKRQKLEDAKAELLRGHAELNQGRARRG